ncbi:hypothetical protein QVD17_37750 [Tagetes erecta]|uniref:Integrase catalytic domain-containing protein n=1 Tax=Tagetes erecta TaxID=13708 RepID=A0AAD8JUS2_TARER|nr:hypothetical protein QVD17_37750 [Tagetes erecta]
MLHSIPLKEASVPAGTSVRSLALIPSVTAQCNRTMILSALAARTPSGAAPHGFKTRHAGSSRDHRHHLRLLTVSSSRHPDPAMLDWFPGGADCPWNFWSSGLMAPAEPLYPIISSWSFMKWGIYNIRHAGGKVFMPAMTDYFSKWIEAESFAQVKEREFIGKRTTNFCGSWGIKMITSTLVHPQANGQAESNNKIIINNLKKKLGSKKGKWAEELPYVLWADRTTPQNATGQTPFSLVFGSEAVIPTEMFIPTARTSIRDPQQNEESLIQDLETIDELRDLAKIRMAAYQQRIAGA